MESYIRLYLCGCFMTVSTSSIAKPHLKFIFFFVEKVFKPIIAERESGAVEWTLSAS